MKTFVGAISETARVIVFWVGGAAVTTIAAKLLAGSPGFLGLIVEGF